MTTTPLFYEPTSDSMRMNPAAKGRWVRRMDYEAVVAERDEFKRQRDILLETDRSKALEQLKAALAATQERMRVLEQAIQYSVGHRGMTLCHTQYCDTCECCRLRAALNNHCPACSNGQSLDKGEGTHLEGTIQHPAEKESEEEQ